MQNNSPIRRLAVYVGPVLIIVLIVITYLLINTAHHAKMSKVTINVIPNDSTVTIDGVKSKTGTKYLEAGRHTFTASKPGFSKYTLSLSTQKGIPVTINLLPEPSSTAAYQWLIDNPDIQTKREGLQSQNVAYIQDMLQKKYPIIKDLPLETIAYKISYGQSVKYPSDPTKIALYISAAPANRSMALQWMEYKGYDPSKFEIIYQ